MAKNNNLTDFLTDMADAIREKKGTSAKINPQDFSDEIKSIETGGGDAVESKEYKDVNFFDYEGTILYSYTWDEAKALAKMPPLPDRTSEGLVCQGWNYTLEEMKAQADEDGDNGYADIGAIYTTIDGKTRFFITLDNEESKDIKFCLISVRANITVDWGDGSVEDIAISYTNFQPYHQYESLGDYVVSVGVKSGSVYLGHTDSGESCVCVANEYINRYKCRKIHLGNNVLPKNYSFRYLQGLESITMPNGITIEENIWIGVFNGSGIYHFNFPVTKMNNIHAFIEGCWRIRTISLSPSVLAVRGMIGKGCNLEFLALPKQTVITSSQNFHSCTKLRVIKNRCSLSWDAYNYYACNSLITWIDASSPTVIGNSCFSENYLMTKIAIPPTVTKIESFAFYLCYSMRLYDFTALSAIPSLTNANAFTGIPADCKIVVPDALVDEWETATNWATYATYIIGKTEYIENGGIL